MSALGAVGTGAARTASAPQVARMIVNRMF